MATNSFSKLKFESDSNNVYQVRDPTAVHTTTTMPSASSDTLGEVFLFIGVTSATYKHGHIYKCELVDSTPTWVDCQVGSIGVGPVTNIACFAFNNSVRITFQDPEDIVIDHVVIAAWEKTVLVRKSGSYPTDINDGTVVLTNSVRNQYKINAFTEPLQEGETYYYRFFTYSTDGVIDIDESQEVTAGDLTWADIASMANQDDIDMRTIFSTRSILLEPNSVFDMDGSGNFQWQIIGVREHGLMLAAYRVLSFDAQFCRQQLAYAPSADTTFQKWEYLTLSGVSVVNGNYYLIDRTATGFDRVWYRRNGTYGIKHTSSGWIIYTLATGVAYLTQTTATTDPYDSSAVWSNPALVMTESKKYYKLVDGSYVEDPDVVDGDTIPADTYYDVNPDTNTVNYGSNVYNGGTIDQYLNTDGDAGTWWTPRTIFDQKSDWTNSQPGFLKGFGSDFLNNVADTEVPVFINNVEYGGYRDVITRKFFLLSGTEVGLQALDEGETAEMYVGAENADRIKYQFNGTSTANWWLRSCSSGYSYNEYGVNTSGSLYFNSAHYGFRVVPACTIGRYNLPQSN